VEARGTPRTPTAVDLPRGFVFAIAHLAFSVLIQLEIYILDIRRLGDGAMSPLAFSGTLPFLQLEHCGVAAVPAALAAVCWVRPRLRWLPQLTLLLLNVWLMVDQAAYGILFNHIDLSLNDGPVSAIPAMLPSLRDSVFAELDAVFLLNLCVCGGVSLWVRYGRAVQLPEVQTRKRLLWATAGWALASFVASWTVDNHDLKHHAVVSLLRSVPAVSPPHEPVEIAVDQLYRPAFAVSRAEPEVDAALMRALKTLRQRSVRPNVLLVVLESVGALQLLPEERISPARTPVLAGLLEKGVLFNSVYATFPGTVRSLVSLQTGGPTITWGSVYDELGHDYTGPTLVKELSRLGYRSALLSAGDMNFENLDGFVGSLRFDRVVDAGSKPEPWRLANRLHSWGVTEDALGEEAVTWMANVRSEGRPFFVKYITVSTHHPYSVPQRYVQTPPKDPRSRYLNALRYSDGFLGRLLLGMQREGVFDNTLIVVTGDHGEAFGERHRSNFIHKNFLYEENVRSFLILAAPGIFQEPIVSKRPASMGDVLPTILRALGTDAAGVPGQSLWPGDYSPRPVFFHKNAHPELWGLRDGPWKFVARRLGEKHFELFDLERDPEEQINQADHYPDRVDLYNRLCAKWFTVSNDTFVERLGDYAMPGGPTLTAEELDSPGPKRLAVGVRKAGTRFSPQVPLRPGDLPVAWTLWVAYPKDRRIRYEWMSPLGEAFSSFFLLEADWTRTRVNYPGPLPLTGGDWRVTLWDRDKRLISTGFEVAPSLPTLPTATPAASAVPRESTGE
jgi:phosphoglycerol transferase MdoB-like AlkP superfamily enzyme